MRYLFFLSFFISLSLFFSSCVPESEVDSGNKAAATNPSYQTPVSPATTTVTSQSYGGVPTATFSFPESTSASYYKVTYGATTYFFCSSTGSVYCDPSGASTTSFLIYACNDNSCSSAFPQPTSACSGSSSASSTRTTNFLNYAQAGQEIYQLSNLFLERVKKARDDLPSKEGTVYETLNNFVGLEACDLAPFLPAKFEEIAKLEASGEEVSAESVTDEVVAGIGAAVGVAGSIVGIVVAARSSRSPDSLQKIFEKAEKQAKTSVNDAVSTHKAAAAAYLKSQTKYTKSFKAFEKARDAMKAESMKGGTEDKKLAEEFDLKKKESLEARIRLLPGLFRKRQAEFALKKAEAQEKLLKLVEDAETFQKLEAELEDFGKTKSIKQFKSAVAKAFADDKALVASVQKWADDLGNLKDVKEIYGNLHKSLGGKIDANLKKAGSGLGKVGAGATVLGKDAKGVISSIAGIKRLPLVQTPEEQTKSVIDSLKIDTLVFSEQYATLKSTQNLAASRLSAGVAASMTPTSSTY